MNSTENEAKALFRLMLENFKPERPNADEPHAPPAAGERFEAVEAYYREERESRR